MDNSLELECMREPTYFKPKFRWLVVLENGDHLSHDDKPFYTKKTGPHLIKFKIMKNNPKAVIKEIRLYRRQDDIPQVNNKQTYKMIEKYDVDCEVISA